MGSKFSTFISSFNPQTKGKQFEVFVKWFLENDPVWKSEVDKVWMWDDYPDRWGKDCGIDLVFKDKNEEVWAVQAKCYDREYPVTKSDVDKFLSESNRSLIQRRLLIATTDNLGPNARKVCADQEKPVTLFLYSDFEDSVIDYPETISDLSRAKLKPKPQPREHQTEAIEKVAKGFKDANKGQLIMACGTGKTFTTLWIKEKLNAELTLILLPSLSLLSQTLKEWTFGMNTPFKSLAVCSDETVTKGAAEDQLLESVQDLSFPVTSDPSLIAEFLQSSGNRVVFSTYQSSPLIADAQKNKNIPSFDLAIADEAHRCAGNVASSFTTILNDDLIKTKLKLYTTATPKTYSSSLKKQAEDLDFEIAGMDDEKVFGKEFHRLSFGEAIDRKLLTDYQLVIIGVDEPMIADWIKRRELLQTNDEIVDAKSLAAEIGLIKAIKDYNLKRVLSFHSLVKSAEDFSVELPKVLDLIDESHKPKGKLATGFVSGKMPTNQRRLKLDQLKELTQGDYTVLSNARCLSEGVDVPALDGIAIIDPKASQIDIVQTVGRAIRLSENKSVGTIVLPIFIENGDDPELSIESTNFKPVWDVIKALRSHDEILAFELDTLRTEIGKQRKRSVQVAGLKKIVIDVPITVDMNFSNSLKIYLIEKCSASWNYWIDLLHQYKREHGNCIVPVRYKTSNNESLGYWVNNRRQNKKILSTEKIKQLNDLGFIWDVLDETWNEYIEALVIYKKQYGNCNVTQKFKTQNGLALGLWVQRQRAFKESLSSERKKQLEGLGFTWDVLDETWHLNFKALVLYKKEYGDCNIPSSYKTIDNLTLGMWINTQRKTSDRLSREKLDLLNSIGFIWDPLDKKWSENFLALINYKKEFGNCNVPNNFKTKDGLFLGRWVGTQRLKEYKLSEDRRNKLNDLGFIWNFLDYIWNENLSSLIDFKKEFGHCNIPQNFKSKNGLNTGEWACTQRLKINQLSADKKKQLDDLGFVWNPLESLWNENIQALAEYKNEFGDCNVPHRYKNLLGLPLGTWVGRQRTFKESLSPERKIQLDNLGFIWDPNEESWNKGIKALINYKNEFGTSHVPMRYKSPDGFLLGAWAQRQRAAKNKLTAKQRLQLEELNFIWSIGAERKLT